MTDPSSAYGSPYDAEGKAALRSQLARERQELEADMAERKRRADAAEMLAWCERRQAAAVPIEKDYHRATMPTRQAPAPASVSRELQAYVKRQIDKHSEAMTGAIGDTLVENMVALENRCERLEAEVRELRDRLDVSQGKHLRSVPSLPSALIA